MKKLTAILLILTLLLSGCGCRPDDLMADVPARVVCLAEVPDVGTEAADFAVRLFQNSLTEGENTLVSPLSVMAALAMTANGANGETLSQMENTLGMTATDISAWIYRYMDGQSDALKLANSIWFTDDDCFTVNQDFLETNANYFQADIYQTALNDDACAAINTWVSEKTDGMIPQILDTIPDDAIAYLINALAFEAEWAETYKEHQVQEETFTGEDGSSRSVELMYSTETAYLEDDLATGFVKYYQGRDYAFAALLPNEGVTVADYVASLTGDHLLQMLEAPQETTVYAAIPKFETGYDAELSEILQSMGMTDAFDPGKADFTGLGTSTSGNLCISRVLHKTAITVAEQGTKAGAATVVEMAAGAAYIEEYKTVTLDRPFVYMLIDCEENLPFFLGTLMDPEVGA